MKRLACTLILTALVTMPSMLEASRYQTLLATSAGRDTLLTLALWEDGRVTGGGRLFRYLQSKNPAVRFRAVEVIGRIQDPTDVGKLLPLLKDSDHWVQRQTIFALGQIGSEEAAPALLKLMQTGPAELQPLITEALGKIGGEEAITGLTERLRAFQSGDRLEAALALARAADPSAIPSLLVAIHDGSAKVSAAAIYALEKVEDNRVAGKVFPFLQNEDAMVRAAAARTLGKQKAGKSVPSLAALLIDTDPAVVINTCNALATILEDQRNDDVVEPLGRIASKHKSRHVRKAAVMALGANGHKGAKDYLAQLTLDASVGIRIETYKALAQCLGGNSLVFLTSGLNDSDRLVRAATIEAYGIVHSDKSLAMLLSTATKERDATSRALAVRALGAYDYDKVSPTVLAALADEDFMVATLAVEALGELDKEEAIPALVERYKMRHDRLDQDVKLAILEVLKNMKASEGEALARMALEDSDKRLREAGVALLTAIEVPVPDMPSDREFYERDFDESRRAELTLPFGTRTARIRTRHGNIELELFGDDAPQTAYNFIKLGELGFYNELTFCRVVPNFVIQGGDPRGDMWGDPGYNIRSEFNWIKYERGMVGMAHAGKDTGGSQFFITHSPQPRLNGRYTVFARVTSGMEFVDMVDVDDDMRVEIDP